jgi:uncharacterized protein YrrD
MRKGKKLIGRPILSLTDGVRVGEVKDVLLGRDNDAVVGLLVDEGGLFGSAMVVPVEEIEAFGRDAVVVASRDSVRAAGEVPEIKEILDRKTSLIGTKVFTETGDAQGAVNDIYFEEGTGRVSALEITGGTWQDATQGVRNLPVSDVVRTGPEILFVQPEAGASLEAQRGGIAGALADAGDKARDAGSQAADKARTATGSAGDASSGSLESRLIGQRTGDDVEDERGAIIVPAGRRVTQADVERAKEAGRLPDLAKAVGAEKLSNAGATMSDATADAGDKAAGLWDQFTRKLGEVTDSTGKRLDEEQTKQRLTKIEDAVGRPVTKAFLDLQDNVVLDVGDLVTHAAVQRAHEAGSLDSLLGSVYKAEVTFDKEELRARRPGEATLERAAGQGAPVVEEMKGKVERAQADRDADAERSRVEAEQGRQQRAQEREQRTKEREQTAAQRKAAKAASPDLPPDADVAAAEATDEATVETTQFRPVGPGRPTGVQR